MVAVDTVINSVLCFLDSAKADYSYKQLEDVVHSFYSHEEIKEAKSLLANLLNAEVVWRRDREKKRKDLHDLLDLHGQFSEAGLRKVFVTNSYKNMPPVGLEKFATILSYLMEEIQNLNEVVPKILDIRTEVINTADTVRQLKINVSEIDRKFTSAVSGMENASREVVRRESNVIEDLHTLRHHMASDNSQDSQDCNKQNVNISASRSTSVQVGALCETSIPIVNPSNCSVHVSSATFDEMKQADLRDSEGNNVNYAGALLKNISAGDGKSTRGTPPSYSSLPLTKTKSRSLTDLDASNHRVVNDPRTGAVSKKPSIAPVSAPAHSRGSEWQIVNNRKRKTGITGKKKTEEASFRAATRYADVFIGRLDEGVSTDVVKDYIVENFKIPVVGISKVEIRSERHVAFKVTVNIRDRQSLFNSELWPEDIVVDKFYNRRKNITDTSSRS